MKADRLLSALLLLQAHGRMTGREMSQRLEVSQRTVHRDMEALSMAGVPVFALRGARGGWQLDEGWRAQAHARGGTRMAARRRRADAGSRARRVGASRPAHGAAARRR